MQVKYLILSYTILICAGLASQHPARAQESLHVSSLFQTDDILPIQIGYSQRDLRKFTNDSTYMNSSFSYRETDGSWKTIEAKLRVRGNYRLKHCYFPPVKIKIRNSVARGTLFEENDELKLVLPCQMNNANNDLVLKEYLAYKIFEAMSPYHFKTRLAEINFHEEKGKGIKEHLLKGILIEDIDNVASRHGGNEIKRSVHPLEQEDICSVKNDFFQFMIGNTDFSIAYRHNAKLIFVGTKTIPIPYDFDMSGLVDAKYAVVSQIQGEKLEISDVSQRLYRGFKRTPAVYEEVRREFLDKKDVILALVDTFEPVFTDDAEFRRTQEFIRGFYSILEDDKSFGRQILAQARVN